MAKLKKGAMTKKTLGDATAIHQKTDIKGGAAHIVEFGNLRVLVTNDDGSWFAQALEIDYAAQGISLPDVKTRFESGLDATINEHLTVFGHILKLLRPAPESAWQEFFAMAAGKYLYSQVSVYVHNAFPFTGIAYIERKAA